jgi:NADPH:quinone reductase-like Zn-dependent oxidoreductase
MAMEAGASVYGTVRARGLERVRALGAEPVVEGDGIGAQLASRSLDAVIDTIGGDALESAGEALRRTESLFPSRAPRTRPIFGPKGVRAAYSSSTLRATGSTGSRR